MVDLRALIALGVSGAVACGGGGIGSGDDDSGDDDAPPADAGPPPPPPPQVCSALPLVDTTQPDRVVGDGSAASCTEAALRAAIGAGGVISFACGDAPVTITLAAEIEVGSDVLLDGGGLVTLSGGNATRILKMDTGNFEALSPTLTVQRMRFVDAGASGPELEGGGGAIFFRGGHVTVIDCVFQGNRAAMLGPDVAGGAIYAIGAGQLTVSGSVFQDNRASNGGAIGLLGAAVSIVNSSFTGNEATGYGANYVEGGVQMGQGGNGGALSMDGQGRTLDICGASFVDNVSGAFGGAIFRTGYESEPNTIDRSLFQGNSAKDRTGAEEDLPSGAGALYLQGVTVTLRDSTVAGNRARSNAGVWILGHGPATGYANLTNVTITGNSTYARDPFTERGVGAGLTVGDNTTGTLLNCTIAGNSAQFGSGVWNVSPLTVRNCIIANDAENLYTPLNCSGSSYASPPAQGENNVQWPTGLSMDDMDCTGGIVRVDPMMGALGDHGGDTPTMLPDSAAALPAGTQCPPTDQRGMPRPGPTCTIGAVELP